MAAKQPAGRLIALEGSGPHLLPAARWLLRRLGRASGGGVSEWDDSNLFHELQRVGPEVAGPSARTLVLLYSADLAFRLRWEIRPALEQGQTVIAAPYIGTGMAFGRAAGLPRRWLAELFAFLPRPDLVYRLPAGEPAHGPFEGFLEFCCTALASGPLKTNAARLRRGFDAYFDALERRKGCQAINAESIDGARTEAPLPA